ncbi:hypothetical protein M758_3G184000 [Ceratodon purpureus]|uniref:Uncharacterized protein n=1 Tax=Ceratodon purpureus TaxID=3225 RepID=A0A8T0IJX0_CERPU|nr:hypothetical protein KC19_3G037600 [Ceratodon purpureus]KAG0584084.1 hypothetical protein KC19_3G183800 [Ceratodon purpureus]KAG0623568.1 hypothetical protein M758_3G184000 [Ceratodon purpureus]
MVLWHIAAVLKLLLWNDYIMLIMESRALVWCCSNDVAQGKCVVKPCARSS